MKGNYTRILYQLDENLSVINVFRNVAEAVRILGISKGQIYNVLNGRQYQTHGCSFMWQEDYDRFVADKETKKKEETFIPDVELVRITLLTTKGEEDVYLPVYRNPVEYR